VSIECKKKVVYVDKVNESINRCVWSNYGYIQLSNSQSIRKSEGKQKMIQQKTEVTGYFKVYLSSFN
jgi:hypothetical protein